MLGACNSHAMQDGCEVKNHVISDLNLYQITIKYLKTSLLGDNFVTVWKLF